jgi:tetratricopeptide (TPR) repeat protein
LLGKGFILYNLERYEDALKTYEQAIKIDSQNAYVWVGKGIVFSDLGKYKDALRA